MNEQCTLIPSSIDCKICIETADMFDDIPDCVKCPIKEDIYRILGFVSGIFETYAILEKEGLITKSPITSINIIK